MATVTDGSAPKRRNNRDRILEAALELFNERGAVSVSTKTIAAHLGISPGNLYYHFADKEHLIRELWHQAGVSVLPTMEAHEDDNPLAPEALVAFFGSVMEGTWRYRFITRDIDELVARDTEFGAIWRKQVDWGRRALLALFERLIAEGSMTRPHEPEDLDRICTNVQVVLMNWPRFVVVALGRPVTAHDLSEGALHGFLVVEPLLAAPFAKEVRRAALEQSVPPVQAGGDAEARPKRRRIRGRAAN